MRTKPILQLLQSVQDDDPPGVVVEDASKKGAGIQPVPIAKIPTLAKTLPEKIATMCKACKETEFRENNVNIVDAMAMHIGLVPTCIYK